jgi:hypothetical protein
MLKDVQKNYKKYADLAKRQRYFVNSEFTKTAIATVYEKVLNIVDGSLTSIPQQVQLQLPKLKKAEMEIPKITLPKLKKIEA